MKTLKFDVVIIGGGAAGLMCAIEAGKRGRSVVILEHNDSVGKKIRISGGGRCNFTNIHASPSNYISENPHFCKSALSRYTPNDFLALVQSYKILFHEKKLGQMFCDASAQQIIDMLVEECHKYQVQIEMQTQVKNISKSDRFQIQTDKDIFESSSLVIACGGLSIPKIGATALGYDIARQFGLKIVKTRAGLVPLVWNPSDSARFQILSGISMDAQIHCGSRSFREHFLFTHRGLSGPAILQISSYWRANDALSINLFPDQTFEECWKQEKFTGKKILLWLKEYFPERFLGIVLAKNIQSLSLANCSNQILSQMEAQFSDWVIRPIDTEGYEKAEVTIGGVDTRELSSQTMESHKVQGLYFIGEVVDVTGHLGGHNFQWAWASGFAAGQSV